MLCLITSPFQFLVFLLNCYFLMYWVYLQFYPQIVLDIILSIVDDFSKYIWLFPLQSKSYVSAFLKYVQNYFSINIWSIQISWVANFAHSKPFCKLVSLFIVLHVPIHMRKIEPLNVVIDILLRLALLYLIMLPCHSNIGLKLFRQLFFFN